MALESIRIESDIKAELEDFKPKLRKVLGRPATWSDLLDYLLKAGQEKYAEDFETETA